MSKRGTQNLEISATLQRISLETKLFETSRTGTVGAKTIRENLLENINGTERNFKEEDDNNAEDEMRAAFRAAERARLLCKRQTETHLHLLESDEEIHFEREIFNFTDRVNRCSPGMQCANAEAKAAAKEDKCESCIVGENRASPYVPYRAFGLLSDLPSLRNRDANGESNSALNVNRTKKKKEKKCAQYSRRVGSRSYYQHTIS